MIVFTGTALEICGADGCKKNIKCCFKYAVTNDSIDIFPDGMAGCHVVSTDVAADTAQLDAAQAYLCGLGGGTGMVDGEINAGNISCITGGTFKYQKVSGPATSTVWSTTGSAIAGITEIEIDGVNCPLPFAVEILPLVDTSAIETALVEKGIGVLASSLDGDNVVLTLDTDIASLQYFEGSFATEETDAPPCYLTHILEKNADGNLSLTNVINGGGESLPAISNGNGTITVGGETYQECKPGADTNIDDGITHDFTDTTINTQTILDISGGAAIECFTFLLKEKCIPAPTFTRKGGTITLIAGKAEKIGLVDGKPIDGDFEIDNPAGCLIQITWDEIE